MAELATDDPHAAAWERRLRPPALIAAIAVLPLLALHLTHPHGALAALETAGQWAIWLVFMVEVVVMLGVVALALAALMAGYMLTGDSPLAGGAQTVGLVGAGMLATFGVDRLHRRRAPPTAEARHEAGLP